MVVVVVVVVVVFANPPTVRQCDCATARLRNPIAVMPARFNFKRESAET